MQVRFGIKSKILFFVFFTSFVIIVGSLIYIDSEFRQKSITYTHALAKNSAEKDASAIASKLNEYLISVKTVATEFETINAVPEDERRDFLSDILKNILAENDEFVSTWSICEKNAIDSLDAEYRNTAGSSILGNFNYVFTKSKDTVALDKYIENDSSKVFDKEIYKQVKLSLNETLLNPYQNKYSNDNILQTSVAVPIIKDSLFTGVVGVDIKLQFINDFVRKIKPFSKGYGFLVAQNGIIVANPDAHLVGKPIDSLESYQSYPDSLKSFYKQASNTSIVLKNVARNTKDYVTFSPIIIGSTGYHWTLVSITPLKTLMKITNKGIRSSIFVALAGLLIFYILLTLIVVKITNPILLINKLFIKLSKGEVDKNNLLNINTNDEVGEMIESVNKLILGLDSIIEFSNQIGKGKLDSEFTLLGENDVLGSSLIKMRDSLIEAKKEEEIGKEEDNKRNWTTQGLAKFGELLRENEGNTEELAYIIVKNLTKYMNAVQCAFFIINDDDKYNITFDLIATIAFNRRKYITRSVKIGESLIGRAAEEIKTIHLTNLPEDYINITTATTSEKPKNLLIVPLTINDAIYGVLEIISFEAFEPHVIEFVEKVGESIASTIANVKVSARTAELLEKSKKQADELAQQEEEMRQNMEEMQATQEEAAKRESEMKGIMNGIQSIAMVAELDLDGQIIKVNDELLNMYGLAKQQVLGKFRGNLEIDKNTNKEDFEQLWIDLQKGKTRKRVNHIIVKSKEYWIEEIFTPIFDEDGDPIRILNLSVDITEKIKMQNEIEDMEDEIKSLRNLN